MKKKEIENIRDDYSPKNNTQRTLEGYASSIKTLAEDLYAKDTHFIFELIQNAEDNNYETETPFLRFVLSKTDLLEGQSNNVALIVENNETGFEKNHVEAICSVGQSTKKKDQGYIGEKGIGFKSVFRVTSCPYIFSNRYHFALPEKDKFSGLGYIVPSWIDTLPENLDKKITSIFLPLDKSDFPKDKVIESLRNIAPETILFLKKLKSLEVEVNTDEHYKIVIEKDDSKFPLVKLTYLKKNDKADEISERFYWVATKEFQKPDNINHEKRQNVTSREVGVAIPLDTPHEGKLFAYLPVWENTGMSFLVNADFLLVSSREGVKESEPWNIWLRQCIPEVFANTLISCLSSELLSFEQKIKAYASIPLTTHHPFLEPEISVIQQKVKISECIFTAPHKSLALPLKTRMAPADFWDLIIDNDFPTILQQATQLVCPELEPYSKTLRTLGVSSLKKDEILECIEDSNWVSPKSDTWLLNLYRYLKKHKIEDDSLKSRKLVRVAPADGKSAILSCDDQQPIYFECDNEAQYALEDVPFWLKELVPISFLDLKFYNLLCEQDDSGELKEWMTKNFIVQTFSVANYCGDILNILAKKYVSMHSQKLVEATCFLAKHASHALNWQALPVVLNNGETIPFSEISKPIVVPENYEQNSGWQHIWKTEADRNHFVVLSNDYDKYIVNRLCLFCGDKIQKFPPPERVNKRSQDLTSYEQRCINSAPHSKYVKEISNWRSPSLLHGEIVNNSKFSESLIAFLLLNNLQDYKLATVHYFYYSDRISSFEAEFFHRIKSSQWLQTQKGFVRPSQAFLPKKEIKEILGDTVPYFAGRLTEETITALGIKAGLTVDALLDTLQTYSGESKVNPEMVDRIYSALKARTRYADPDDIIDAFENNKLIFIPDKETGGQWFSLNEVIWEDAHNALGDDFIYLKKFYPWELKDFFVKTLKIKENADPECFAQRWLKIQDNPIEDSQVLRGNMEAIYRTLLPITKEEKPLRPQWWDDFREKVLIFTQKNTFVNSTEVIVPDDGELKRIFSASDVNFVWRPEKDSFNQWASFYEAFEIPRISESVSDELSEDPEFAIRADNEFVTESAIIMLATWLREKDNNFYSSLLNDGIFQELSDIKEAATSKKIKILFTLKTSWLIEEVEEDYPVFWDRQNGKLILSEQTSTSDLKRKTAGVIAKALMNNHAYKDLAHWIELILGANNIERIRDDGWSAPKEILKLFKKDVNTSPKISNKGDENPERATPKGVDNNPAPKSTGAENSQKSPDTKTAEPSDKNEPEKQPEKDKSGASGHQSNSTTENDEASSTAKEDDKEKKNAPSQPEELLAKFKEAFNRNGKTLLSDAYEEGDYFNDGTVKNPSRRRKKSSDGHYERLKNEPAQDDRRRETIRTMLEPADPATRSYLLNLYAGKCQVCGKTFPQRDGSPFFIVSHIVERKNARLFDNHANALCLCPLHFAKWRHGAVESKDILEQILNKKTRAEGADDELSLKITLCGESCSINFKEKHLVDMQAILGTLTSAEN